MKQANANTIIMSSAYYNDYTIASNNSINENKYNTEKLMKSPSYRIKKILRPILRVLSKKSSKKVKPTAVADKSMDSNTNSQCYSYDQQNDFWSSEIDENFANEELESRIQNEINQCEDDAAIYVYNDDECEIQSVHREQKFIPVHFARTEAGTFFWTTMQRPVYDDEDECWSHCGDRWVQA